MTQIFEHINDQEPYHIHLELHHQKEPIILCSCASGIGSANKLKTIIVDSLPEGFEVKVMILMIFLMIMKLFVLLEH